MEIRNFSFENLEVYGKIRELIKNVYRLKNCFPKEERFGLGDQLRRAVVSVNPNQQSLINKQQATKSFNNQ
jgi:four helix bundle protein